MTLDEEYLLEVTFLNPTNAARHYRNHVLSQYEKFNPNDPKFPSMSLQKYMNKAKDLSEAPSAPYTDTTAPIIGFKIKRNEDKSERYVKVKRHSSYYSKFNFSEIVIFVDDDVRGHEIVSYYLGKPKKLNKLLLDYSGELPSQTVEELLKEVLYLN